MKILLVIVLAFAAVSAFKLKPPRTNVEERFVAETDVLFYLYTRDNPTEYQLLIPGNDSSLISSNFRLNKPVKIYAHGKGVKPLTPLAMQHNKPYLDNDDVNVINVDWSKGSSGNEESTIAAAGPTGTFVGKFIDWLTTFGVKTSDVHLLAVSIGSHVIGYAGRTTTKGKVAYLTACDPPRNYWETADDHVGKGDAAYVEIIHTNTRSHGIRAPIGDVDFYPNWGVVQPGCSGLQEDNCSHGRSYELFINSIDNEYFLGSQCSGYEEIVNQTCSNIGKLHLGGIKPKNASGVFYVETTGTSPFYVNSTQATLY